MAPLSVPHLIALTVLIIATAANAQQHCDTLDCYLEKLTVKFPNTAVVINDRGLTAHFNAFSCTGLAIDGLTTSASGNATKGTLSVDFSPALTCHGEFQLESNGTLYGGDFSATLSKNTSVSITASLLTAEKLQPDTECVLHGVPDAFSLDHCKIHIRLDELHLVAYDQSHQQFVDDLLVATREAVEGAGGIVACTELANVLEGNATDTLREFASEVIVPFTDCPDADSSSATSDQRQATNATEAHSTDLRTTAKRKTQEYHHQYHHHHRQRSDLGCDEQEKGGCKPPGKATRFPRLRYAGRAKAAELVRTDPAAPTVNLGEIPLFDAVGYVFNVLVGKNGKLPLHNILSLFLNEDGAIAVDEVKPFRVNDQLLLSLSNVVVRGIETLNLPLFHTVTNTTVDSALELGRLHVAALLHAHMTLPRVVTVTTTDNNGKNATATATATAASGELENDVLWWHNTHRDNDDGDVITLNTDVSASVAVRNVFADVLAQLLIDSAKLDRMNQEKAKQPECLIDLFQRDTKILSLDGSFELSGVTLAAGDATALEGELATLVSNAIVALRPFDAYLHATVRHVLETLVKPAANAELAAVLETPHVCPNVAPHHKVLIDLPSTLLASVISASVFLALVLFYLVASKCAKESHEEERIRLLSLPMRVTEQHFQNFFGGSGVARPRVRGVRSALLFSKRLPLTARLGIPLFGLVIAAMFASSNVSYAASVVPALYPREERQEDPILLASMFDFNLKNTVSDMWDAGVYPLSILVLVFSGAWPYVKVALLLFAWVAPTRVLPTRKRGQLLVALDALGKWSLIDSFMMVSMVVAFHFRIEFPHYLATAHDHFVVGVIVEVCYGMSSFLFATLLSLVLVHSALACHRKALEPRSDEGDTKHISVVGFFIRASKNRRRAVIIGATVALMLFVALLVLVAGIFVYSFRFEFLGAGGFLLKLFDISTYQLFSVYSLAKAMPLFAPSGTLPAIYFIAVTFVLSIAIFPVLELVLMAFLWIVPLRRKQQRALSVVVELLNAWSAIEVYILIVLTELVEIRKFADFIADDACHDINPLLARYFAPLLGEGNTNCFDITATLLPGIWLFLIAAILYVVFTTYAMAVCRRVFVQRERWEVSNFRKQQGIN